MRIICARRVWIAALVPLLLLLLAGAAMAIPDWGGNNPLNPPEWWSEDDGYDMRMGWWTWAGFIDYRGTPPTGEYWDFTPSTMVQPLPWYWTSIGQDDYFLSEAGILLPTYDATGADPARDGAYELDLELSNSQLAPYKLWFTELEFGDITPADWTRLKDGRFSVESVWFKKHIDGENVELPDTAWEIVDQGWDDENHSWWIQYRIEPQPDWEKIVWWIDTDGTADRMQNDFHVTRAWTGTKCTPEPVTVVLLALGLPLGILARRRKD